VAPAWYVAEIKRGKRDNLASGGEHGAEKKGEGGET